MSPAFKAGRVILVAIFSSVLFISACEQEKERPNNGNGIDSLAPTLVSLSPNVTEILFAIGAGEHLVGVTSFCDFPPEAREKTSVGGLIDTNFEVILSLSPDYVIDLETQFERTRRLRELGMTVKTVRNETLDDVLEAVTELGVLVGNESEASTLREEMEDSLNSIREQIEGSNKPSVAFVIDHGPGVLQDVFVVGASNFVNELISYAGGENVFSDLGSGYPQVNQEAFLMRDPDVIFDVTQAGEDVYSDLRALSSVENGRIYFSFDKIIQVPGPRLIQSLQYMAGKLHPEIEFEMVNGGN